MLSALETVLIMVKVKMVIGLVTLIGIGAKDATGTCVNTTPKAMKIGFHPK